MMAAAETQAPKHNGAVENFWGHDDPHWRKNASVIPWDHHGSHIKCVVE